MDEVTDLLQHLILDAQELNDLHEMRSHGGTPGRVGKGDAVSRQQRRLQFFWRGNIRLRGSRGGGKTGNRITQTIGDSVLKLAGLLRLAYQDLRCHQECGPRIRTESLFRCTRRVEDTGDLVARRRLVFCGHFDKGGLHAGGRIQPQFFTEGR